MPKAPITFREVFFTPVRGQAEGTLRPLEWNHVETELGTMVEPYSPTHSGAAVVVNADVTDRAINKVSIMDDNKFYEQYHTGGTSLSDFNA
jgi:hypothetical protein